MKLYLLLFSFAFVFTNCTTAYKTGQTPDDVYFSPERQRDEYVRVEERNNQQYEPTEQAREDRYLRMKTSYRRYSALDEYDCYGYNASNYYRYNDYYRYNNYRSTYEFYKWNPQWGYNYNNYNSHYYNPYYNSPYYAGNVKPVYNKPRTGNMNIYNGDGNPNTNSQSPSKGRSSNNSSNNTDNYRGSGNNAGGFLRDVFNSPNSSNKNTGSSNSNSNSSNSSTPASSSSSSSSGSTSAPVRKF